jgi:septum formation protein
VLPADIAEVLGPGPLAAAVAALALAKARAVAGQLREGIVLGKPADPAEAHAMLRRLRGREHEVLTGVAVVNAASGRSETASVVSRVRMAEYGEADIAAYVATGEPLDKAGAYAIQGLGAALVAALEGSFSNVVGLPLQETARLLAAFGVPVSDPPAH